MKENNNRTFNEIHMKIRGLEMRTRDGAARI